MKWNSLSDFIAMGGYGVYVWGSYAVALALMVIEPWLAARRHRQALRALDETNSQE
jgi:heme exporter protein D